MNKIAKILVTIGVVFVFFLLFAVLVGSSGDAGQKTPGFLGILLMVGAFGAIRAIWKSNINSKKNENNHESSILQK